MFLQIQTPVPNDLPLPLPLPEWMLVFLLVVSFLIHLIFVNLMVGGTILSLVSQIKGLKDDDYHNLSHEIARTITVNKSLAVVMGVAPLLCINTLYTMYFYSANALTGIMWIAIVPLVTVAFLLTYLNKYTWKTLDNNRPLCIAILSLATAIFLFIPLIFLTNVNLMLFPEKWGSVSGFLSALLLPNVFPRYFHFIFASLAITGLFLFWYMGRKSYPFDNYFKNLTRYDLKKKFYSLTLAASAAQFVMGPLVMLTLPTKGFSWNLILVILTGASFSLPAMYWMWKAITGDEWNIDKNFGKIVTLLSITVIMMGSGRHIYRANALDPHRKLMAAKTEAFIKASEEARNNPEAEVTLEIDTTLGDVAIGGAVFKQYCAACHLKDSKLVGPPILEMVSIYKDNPDGLISWIKNPGKKRADAPQMPAFGNQLDQDQLNEVSKYILSIK